MDVLYEKELGDDSLTFYSDGTILCTCSSYEINGIGSIELSKEEALELYNKMKEYLGGESK